MPKSFHRDRFFWVVAVQTAIVNFYLGGFGPAQSLLRADQGTSLTIAGLHGTAMGVASIFAGWANPRIAHRFGRSKASWIGLSIFITGLTLFVISPPVYITIPATLITGFGTSIVINTMLTKMSHHYGKAAEVAIPQANGIASVGFVTGTALIGTIAIVFPQLWRLGLLLALPVALVLFFVGREKDEDEHVPDEEGPQGGKLSRSFWIAWVGFVACISSEFATSFWASALLKDRVGSTAAISTVGMGISMQFALSSIRLIGLSDGRPDLAIGRASLAAGVAIAGAPFLLGLLGDNFGISRAYIMVFVLIAIAFVIVKVIPSKVAEAV